MHHGKTLPAIAAACTKDDTKGGQFLLWLAQSYKFVFPKHLRLYWAIKDLCDRHTKVFDRNGKEASLQMSAASHAQFQEHCDRVIGSLPEEEDVPCVSGYYHPEGTDADAPSRDEADVHSNSISDDQKAHFHDIVESMETTPYSSWDRMTVEPPDASKSMNFSGTSFNLLPITFWSPADYWAHLGVNETPCARHGWAHARFVTLGCWRMRLVKGILGDCCWAGVMGT